MKEDGTMTEPVPPRAADVMTTRVVSVLPSDRVEQVARVLLQNGISAAPVIGADGALAGMVSEGDLIGRSHASRDSARRDWWLSLLADGETLSPEFLATLRATERTAADVMATPVVTVSEAAEVADIAELLTSRRIKRVPVLRDGRVVGIVSRSDLLRTLAGLARRQAPAPEPEPPARMPASLPFVSAPAGTARETASSTGARPTGTPSAEIFRGLEDDFRAGKIRQALEVKSALASQAELRIKELVETHIDGPIWRTMLAGARQAAAHGEQEFLLLTFPSDLCVDRARAINAAEAGWPATLRGEAAEIYRNWDRDLRSRGFRCSARVLNFPGGFPGDVGLYLAWG